MVSPLCKATTDTCSESGRSSGGLRQRGALLINLGTPDAPTVPAVRRYLAEFLGDPAVIQWPVGLKWLTGPLGRVIAYLRAPSSAKMYQRIWTERGSPLRVISDEQIAGLQAALPPGWRVFGAMRYGRPSIPQTLRQIKSAGIEELVIISMYPQFSGPTTGTALREVFNFFQTDGHTLHVTTRTSWYEDEGYITAQTELLQEYARSRGLGSDTCYLVFSAHGLPVSYVRKGDPYREHIQRTVALLGQQLNWPVDRLTLAYQSRLGPVEWLRPYTDELLLDLARRGEKRILVCPVSFTTDCLETLEEIDVRYREVVERTGAKLYVCPALNTFGPFITALKHLALRGPRPMRGVVRAVASPNPDPDTGNGDDLELCSLVMVGLSLKGRLGAGLGPDLVYANADGLRRVKRSACEIPAILRSVREESGVHEAFLWNTCHRFELYAFLAGSDAQRRQTIGAVRRRAFPTGNSPQDDVNVLVGVSAWHHFLRTACGLNSSLPGERDVLEQLHAGYRLAECAETIGSFARRLLGEAVTVEAELRRHTDWGRFDPNYCQVALSRVSEAAHLDYSASRIVVIGGSTTSAGVLRTLQERFDVPGERLALFYRGHKNGGHLKVLRRALGCGRRVRVQTYTEESVTRAVLDANVVIFGVDREEPVIHAERLRGERDFLARPLTFIDFNSFASTRGMERLPGVRLFTLEQVEAAVSSYADSVCGSETFQRATEAAEAWIHKHIRTRLESGDGVDAEVEKHVEPELDVTLSDVQPSGHRQPSCLGVSARASVQGEES